MSQISHLDLIGRAPRVAIHEHSDALRAVLQQTLRDEGYDQIQDLRSVAEIHAALSAGSVDLLLLDLDAPDAPGADPFSLCRDIRSRHPRLGLLAMSTRVNAERLAHSLNAGSDHLLCKPLSAGELAAHVRRVLERARAWAQPSSTQRLQF